MEDLEDPGDSPPMISNTTAYAILISIFWVTLIIVFIMFIRSDDAAQMWNDNPRTLIINITSIFLASLFISVLILIISKVFTKRKELKEAYEHIENYEEPVEKMPFLALPVDNSNGQFKNNVCQVCNETIGLANDIVQCPQCKTVYHYTHLYDLILETDKCLNCGFKIKK